MSTSASKSWKSLCQGYGLVSNPRYSKTSQDILGLYNVTFLGTTCDTRHSFWQYDHMRHCHCSLYNDILMIMINMINMIDVINMINEHRFKTRAITAMCCSHLLALCGLLVGSQANSWWPASPRGGITRVGEESSGVVCWHLVTAATVVGRAIARLLFRGVAQPITGALP